MDGVRTMTVGTVSMDMLAVDLTPCPQAGIGTPVELWGKEIKLMMSPPLPERWAMS